MVHTAVNVDSIHIHQERYSSFDSGIGLKIEEGTTDFEELEVNLRF